MRNGKNWSKNVPQKERVFSFFFFKEWTFSSSFFRLTAEEYTGLSGSPALAVSVAESPLPPGSVAASQPASQLAGRPASAVDKLISDLCYNWQPTPNSWGISYELSEAELVLFIDGARSTVNTVHQIRLMGEKKFEVYCPWLCVHWKNMYATCQM